MLNLTSEQWSILQGPFGTGEHIPQYIKQLQQQYDQDLANQLYEEHLYHQNTIYPCTYATVPYLVEIALKSSELETIVDIYIMCGMFEAWNELNIDSSHQELPADWIHDFAGFSLIEVQELYQSYQQALQLLQQLISTILAQIEQVEESQKVYILAATAALQGYRQWARCFLSYSSGEEYILACSHCNQDIYIWTDHNSELTEWRAYAEDPVMNADARYEKIIPNPEYQNQYDLKWLYTYMNQLQAELWLTQLPYFGGRVKCPHCFDDILIKEALLQSNY